MEEEKTVKEKILDILFPPLCVHCKASLASQKKYLCEQCWSTINLNSSLFCPRCMNRLPTPSAKCHESPYLLAPATFFTDPLPALIHTFKYKKIERIQVTLSAILIAYLTRSEIDLTDITLVPIPLHPERERKRGFNQATLLAHTVANYFALSLEEYLVRVKKTEAQATLSAHKRPKNIAGAFALKPNSTIKNKRILLVDDVTTSGATLYEAAHVLKQNGARSVIGLTVAKAG